MADVVTEDEIQDSQPQIISVSGTVTVVSASRLGKRRRTSFIAIPTTAGVTVTMIKGAEPGQGTVLQGIPLITNQPWGEADGDGFKCYQGPINAIASGAGSLSWTETFDR